MQHEAGQKAFDKAQEQIKSTMHKIVEKERELQNIEIALEKSRSRAKEGRENEQVLLHNHVLV